VARALDHVGDRWTLLILRDLHAGPMRFGEVQAGLPGLASNLLSSRLDKLQSDGLIERDGPLYRLTGLGRRTDAVLWELAQLGMRFPPDPELKRPGHLRLAAVTLQSALRRVALPELGFAVELVLDGESFTVAVGDGGRWIVRYGAPPSPGLVVTTAYASLMAAASGELPLARFREEHVQLDGPSEAAETFAALMTRVMVGAFHAVAE
jgi:DNA-binding HxlR family transcriptional regulator